MIDAAARAEAAELRARLKRLRAEAAANEQKWQRTLERELELIGSESLAQLLAVATRGLAVSYGLDAVQLVLADPGHEIQHLLLGMGERPDEFLGVTFADTLAGIAPQLGTLQRPWLGSYVHADHGLLFRGAAGLQSLALLPLKRQQTPGALCFGSRDPARFSHRDGSDFLQHLSSVTSICLENACNRARVQRSGSTIACLMIDVDRFKALNDHYGHAGGDTALRTVAKRIEAQIRASDTAARFGGDEFTLLLPDTSLADAARLAERIRVAMAPPVELGDGAPATVTLSIGVAALAGRRGDADFEALGERLLTAADAALYAAKAAGRDRVAVAGG